MPRVHLWTRMPRQYVKILCEHTQPTFTSVSAAHAGRTAQRQSKPSGQAQELRAATDLSTAAPERRTVLRAAHGCWCMHWSWQHLASKHLASYMKPFMHPTHLRQCPRVAAAKARAEALERQRRQEQQRYVQQAESEARRLKEEMQRQRAVCCKSGNDFKCCCQACNDS